MTSPTVPVARTAPDVARGWFPADAASHVRDAPKFCPACGAALQLGAGGHGIAVEFWEGPDRVFVCFCGDCRWSGDIRLSSRVVGHEPDDEA